VRLVEAYAKEQGLFHGPNVPEAIYSEILSLDLGTVEPSLAGPKRPQDRVSLKDVKRSFATELPGMIAAIKPKPDTSAPKTDASVAVQLDGQQQTLHNGSVVIAAITSCTNTSNPSVMLAAGLVAKKAVEKGLQTKPWVKTSLAPGSKVVTEYLIEAGLMRFLEQLRFHLVGYGCTTCIGNSGPLPEPVAEAVKSANLVVAAVLSGNRNFEGRVHPQVRANYLASPPLVVAYALAGRVDIDLHTEPLGHNAKGEAIYLRDVWPTQQEIADVVARSVRSEMFRKTYDDVFTGDETWRNLPVPEGDLFRWDPASTYVRHPPYFENMGAKPGPIQDIAGARVLAVLGDSITTDHISPAGDIDKQGPAAKYLTDHNVAVRDFNSFGARRGNDEVMVRGTFANIRLKNLLVPGVEGGVTRHLPDNRQMSIFEASELYQKERVPLVVLAGKEYGSGSSRDWAAKGPRLLGVKFVIAESFERIHRSNLVGMGVLPLQFPGGQSAAILGLNGEEVFSIEGLNAALSGSATSRSVTVRARKADGKDITFSARVRIDTPQEVLYYQNGGILQYVLRQLLAQK
jgi:aconitate hydratase